MSNSSKTPESCNCNPPNTLKTTMSCVHLLQKGCSFFAYSWKLLAYSGAFLLSVDNFSFLLRVGAFLLPISAFFAYSWSFFAHSGKVRLIRALRDCKQRSLTVSKKAPTVSKKTKPFQKEWYFQGRERGSAQIGGFPWESDPQKLCFGRGEESMGKKFGGKALGEVWVNFLALFVSKPHVFMRGALH